MLLAAQGAPRRAARAAARSPLLAAWLGLSIWWSTLPDRSWDYADRALVYLLFAALGLWLAPRTRELANGLCILLGAVVVWSLAGKVLPPVHDYGPPGLARLSAPVGLWNQLALLGAFALPLALWRRRLAGTLLAYGWIVALLLTYSRGGILTAVVVVAAWLALTDERTESAATLVAAAVPGGCRLGDRVLAARGDERRAVDARAVARRSRSSGCCSSPGLQPPWRWSGCRVRGSRRLSAGACSARCCSWRSPRSSSSS